MTSTMDPHATTEEQGIPLEDSTSTSCTNHFENEAKNGADLACNQMDKQDPIVAAAAPQINCTICRSPSPSCQCQHRLSLLSLPSLPRSSILRYDSDSASEADGSDLSTPDFNTSAPNSRATTSHGRAEGVEATDFAKEPRVRARSVHSTHTQHSGSHSFADPASLPSMLDPDAPLPKAYERSICSTLDEVVPRAPKQQPWYETEEQIAFQFKLTPKSSKGRVINVPRANRDGSVSLPPPVNAAESSSGSGPSLAGLKITDELAVKRLLTGALFTMEEGDMPRAGETTVLNFGLADRMKVNAAVAPVADANGRVKEDVGKAAAEMETVQWKVVITPAEKGSKGGMRKCLLPRYK